MPDQVKTLRIFELAKLLNVTTTNILELLETLGYELPRKMMQSVDEAMYLEVLRRFRRDIFNQYRADRKRVLESLARLGYSAVPEPMIAGLLTASEPASSANIYTPSIAAGLSLSTLDLSSPFAFREKTAPDAPPSSNLSEPETDIATRYLPLATIFAPVVPRVAPPAPLPQKDTPPAQAVRLTHHTRHIRKPHRPKEPQRVKLLIRFGRPNLPELKVAPLHSMFAPKPSEPELNNVDLEIIERIVNMSYRRKLSLLEQLMFGD
jgi:hypothetical protein